MVDILIVILLIGVSFYYPHLSLGTIILFTICNALPNLPPISLTASLIIILIIQHIGENI